MKMKDLSPLKVYPFILKEKIPMNFSGKDIAAHFAGFINACT